MASKSNYQVNGKIKIQFVDLYEIKIQFVDLYEKKISIANDSVPRMSVHEKCIIIIHILYQNNIIIFA